MKIEKDDNLLSGYRILGSGNCWDVEADKISILVSGIEIIPMSGNDMYVTAYGPGTRQIAEDIIKLSRNIGREEIGMLKAENEALKETIEVLQRQLEKERNKNAIKSEVENLIDRLKQLCETEKKFKQWQSIVLKQMEANPNIFNERIKEN